MAQLEELLPSKCEALSQIPVPVKKIHFIYFDIPILGGHTFVNNCHILLLN
jgi:hypothetical protein